MIGNHPSYKGQLVESITADKQLAPNDSGKVFMCSQSAAVTVNLPQLSTKIAGWNAKFILSTASSNDFHIMGYGLTNAGGATGDSDVMYFTQKNPIFLTASETKDWAALTDGDSASEDITVTGAALGDFALASMGVDVADYSIEAAVTAADTVTAKLSSDGQTADLASSTCRVMVIKQGAGQTTSTQDGVFFDASNAVVGYHMEIFTDGTSWFVHAYSSTGNGIDDVDA